MNNPNIAIGPIDPETDFSPSPVMPDQIVEKTPTPQTIVPKAEVLMDADGLIKPRNIEESYRVARAYLSSGLLPKRYSSPEMVMVSMQLAVELGLKPLTALRQIAVVNGTPSLFGDLPLAMVQASGKMEWCREYLIDKDGREICSENKNLAAQPWGAVTAVKRKGDQEPTERFFTLEDARQANLLSSPVWKTYPKRMLQYRARSQALKDKFADALNGVAIAEYDFNALPDVDSPPALIDVKSTTGKAAELSEKLKEKT